MNDDNWSMGFIAVLGLCGVVFFFGHSCGFNAGVRAGVAGKAVVVPLPDGTSKVVRVKKEDEKP